MTCCSRKGKQSAVLGVASASASATMMTLLILASSVQAQPQVGAWTAIYRGVDHATGEAAVGDPRLQMVNALRVDLNDPTIQLFTTPSNGASPRETDGQTTRQFVDDVGVQVAVNANFFTPCCDPGTKDLLGLAVSEGNLVSPQQPGSFELTVTEDNQATINTDSSTLDLTGVFTAVEGGNLLLLEGVVQPSDPRLDPRTVLGLSEDSRYLYLLTIDGRQPGFSDGATLFEAGEWLQRFGAYTGVNLDGGGSTTMVQSDDLGGSFLLNSPSDGERVVGYNFGVSALPVPSPSSFSLMLMALVSLAGCRRNRF